MMADGAESKGREKNLATDPVAQEYIQQSRDFLEKARRYLAEDDLHQASEKGWGAASHMTKAVAHANDWEYAQHRHFHAILDNVRRKTGINDLLRLSAVANGLHKNFYERKSLLNAEDIGIALANIQALLDILEPLALASP